MCKSVNKLLDSKKNKFFFNQTIIILTFVLLIAIITKIIYPYFLSSEDKYYFKSTFAITNLPYPTNYISPIHYKKYIANTNDTYYDIAKKFNLREDSIISCQQSKKNVHYLRIGELVYIPNIDGLLYKKKKSDINDTNLLSTLEKKYGIKKSLINYYNLNWKTTNSIFIPYAFYSLDIRFEKLGSLFLNPLKEKVRLTSSFGYRIHPISKVRKFHKGIDLAGKWGSTVYSAQGGKVIKATEVPGYGKIVVIKHYRGYSTLYAHLSKILVKKGQKIVAHQPIGRVGNTGFSTGTHLHFEIRKQGIPINPIGLVSL